MTPLCACRRGATRYDAMDRNNEAMDARVLVTAVVMLQYRQRWRDHRPRC
jgi:hypothetical protein